MRQTHVCVLYGGRSVERDVSVATGHRVARALQARGYEVTGIDVDETLVRRLKEMRPDLVFIAVHGRGGEDGTIQELLEILGLKYTGAGVLASLRAIDKVLTKRILQAEGIPTPPFQAFSEAAFHDLGAKDTLEMIVEELGLPLVVKPAAQGSAFGISIVPGFEGLPKALATALSFDGKVLLEKYVSGRELAVSIMGGGKREIETLPIVEAVPRSEHPFYDFDSRYVLGETDFIVPAELDPEVETEVLQVARNTYLALGCSGFGRVDVILDDAGHPWVLELNTIPGLTESSLMPLAAEAAGLSFEDLVQAMVDSAVVADSA
jgi:D-alanine-D-alanine ligase